MRANIKLNKAKDNEKVKVIINDEEKAKINANKFINILKNNRNSKNSVSELVKTFIKLLKKKVSDKRLAMRAVR